MEKDVFLPVHGAFSTVAPVVLAGIYLPFLYQCNVSKGTGSRDRIQLFVQKRTVLVVSKYSTSPGF